MGNQGSVCCQNRSNERENQIEYVIFDKRKKQGSNDKKR
jgi:hypothetical protein